LDKAAKRGSVAAAKYLVNVFYNGAPVRLGKKEAKMRAAEDALANSPWADLIRTPERANDLDDEPSRI
jgi:TPR repeat protein